MEYSKLEFLQSKIKASDEEMGKVIGISGPGYAKMIRNKTCSVYYLEKFAHFFKVPIIYFFEDDLLRMNNPNNSDKGCKDCEKKQKIIEKLREEKDEVYRKYTECLEEQLSKKNESKCG